MGLGAVDTGGQGGSAHDALAALAWLIDAGADVAVDEAPVGWLKRLSPMADKADEAAIPAAAPGTSVAPDGAAVRTPADLCHIASLADLRAEAEARLGTRLVFCDGEPSSGVMVVGEGPAVEDFGTGAVFSGEAGRLLDRMLAAIGLDRRSSYLTNLLLTRPRGGKPGEEDIAAALPILRRHVALVRPRALLLMGGVPAQALLGTDTGIGKLRGRWVDLTVDGVTVPALPTFNPAYLLRRPIDKRLAWADLVAFKSRLSA